MIYLIKLTNTNFIKVGYTTNISGRLSVYKNTIPNEMIEFFMNDYSIYNNDIVIRYGDTHPHKPIPKLGQTRNIIIAVTVIIIANKNTAFF